MFASDDPGAEEKDPLHRVGDCSPPGDPAMPPSSLLRARCGAYLCQRLLIAAMGRSRQDVSAGGRCLPNTKGLIRHIYVGWGGGVTIKELAIAVSNTLGYQGTIPFGVIKPDGAPRKLIDSSRLNAFGRQPMIELETG